MLLADVTTKTARERSPLAVYVGIGIAAAAFLMIMVAETLGQDMAAMIADMPAALTGIMGGVGANYVVTELFGIIAPVAVLTVAIGGGINALAGEERRHTAELLLTQPVSRRSVVRSKSIVLIGDTAIACGFLLAGSSFGAAVFDVTGFGPRNAIAASLHLYLLAVAFGAFALAVGNTTGSTATGMGAAAGLAVVANLWAGMLPLIDGAGGWVRMSPWYYFNGSEPLVNGIDIGHLAVLGAMAAVCFAFAVWVADHRDIGSGASGGNVRLPSIGSIRFPWQKSINHPRVNSIVAKTLTERFTFLVVLTTSINALSVMVSLMYPSIKGSLAQLNDAFPLSMRELFGATDMSTPAGFVQVEMLSLMTPLALIAVGVVMGVDAIAGEASRRTLGLLVATPLPRSRIVLDKAAALVLAVGLAALAMWLGLLLGSALAGLNLSATRLAASLTHQALLGIFFGMLGLGIGSIAERSRALRTTLAVIVVTYFGNWLLSQRASLADGARLSPWYYAVDSEPMFNGVDPSHLGVLAAASLVLLAVAIWGFERRDLNA